MIKFLLKKVIEENKNMLGDIMITDSTGHSITNYPHYYEKRMVEFGSNKKKRHLKIIINNERSQLILWYSLSMRNAHDTKELINMLSTMDSK